MKQVPTVLNRTSLEGLSIYFDHASHLILALFSLCTVYVCWVCAPTSSMNVFTYIHCCVVVRHRSETNRRATSTKGNERLPDSSGGVATGGGGDSDDQWVLAGAAASG